ncbi:MAG: hypothetical protein J6B85_10280 [Lachnospiraceae bacterium]|nr:hypothetical protein [Lachnospiraceae bacterium]
MNRLKKLWQAYYKNKKRIGTAVSVTLTALFFVGIGYLCISIWLSDRADADNITERITQSPLTADRNRDYGEAGLRVVAENDTMRLYADTTNGEIAWENKLTGYTVYSNPQDRAEDTYVIQKPRLESQLMITYLSLKLEDVGTGELGRETLELTANSAQACVSLGGLNYELIENGIRFVYEFPNLAFRIPVQYTLSGNYLAVEILNSEIEELWPDRYLLLEVELLPFFGAGGIEDEGYAFVPDGSGALMYYNNGKQTSMQYAETIYGRDAVVPEETAPYAVEQIAMPVFGLKTNESALFAIITSGEALGQINAVPSKKISGYNQAYSTMKYRDSDITGGSYSKTLDIYTDPFSEEPYRIEYYMLEDEEADYSGMARLYRSWLIENGRLNDSELTKEPYFMVNLYGAISVEKYVMGIKKPVITALTTYQDVIDIVKQLKENGIDHIMINYIGAMKGGLDTKVMDSFQVEPELGSKKDFERMLEYLEQEQVVLFVEEDPINLHENGNGYQKNRDSIMTFWEKYAYQYYYSLNLGKMDPLTRWTLLKPNRAADAANAYFASAGKNGLTGYSAAELGQLLYSDYDEKNPVYREESLSVWESILKSAAENFEYVMVEGENAYVLPYVDVVRDVAIDFSNYDVLDESVPFYQMVVKGSVVMGASSLNLSGDYHYRFLKALETGCSLSYTWIAGDVTQFVDTVYNDMMSTSFDYWLEVAAGQYTSAKELLEQTSDSAIMSHRKLADNVFETTYENGIRVYVNYSEEDYQYGELLIPARGYASEGF